MAEEADREERTEEPTAKRLQDARDKGQVPRSRELVTTAVMLAGSATLLGFGGELAQRFALLLKHGLGFGRTAIDNPAAMSAALGSAVVEALLVLMPFFAAVMIAAVLAPMALGGWVFSPTAFAPQFSRLSPLAGLQRIFGLTGLVELSKALLKFVVVGAVAGSVTWWLMRDVVALGSMPIIAAMGRGSHILGLAFLLMSAALGLIAVFDAPYQWWSFRRNLKMTRQQVRDEMKESEGRPEIKAKVRQLQQRYARRRMMLDVPRADVVIVNPEHYSVALKYDSTSMRAPRVLAKGRDLVALEIRRIAADNGVPVFEAPPLARALYGSTEIGSEIPSGLYVAVAQVLSYLYQLKTAAPAIKARLRRPVPDVGPEFSDA